MKKILTIFALIISTNSVLLANAAPADSVGTITIAKQKYVVHKVEPKETLYSLLKKYGCSAKELLESNPSLKGNNSIFIGQTINFPTSNSYVETIKKPVIVKKEEVNFHKIEKGETLFSISQAYGLKVDELKALNNLSSNNITVGEKLAVKGTIKKDYKRKAVVATKKAAPVEKKAGIKVIPNAPKGVPVTEHGLAVIIPTNSKSKSYLALHRTAPIGTLVKVTNEATRASVMVKVVGHLPKSGADQDIMIKLSPAAYKKLGPKDSKLRAKVNYVTAPQI